MSWLARLQAAELVAMQPRLRAFAWRLAQDRSAANDLVSRTTVAALEQRNTTWFYLAAVLKNFFLQDRRQVVRRADQDESHPGYAAFPHQANQDARVLTLEVLTALLALPHAYQAVMTLVAQEFKPGEIATKLDIPVSEVYWRTDTARKLLRERGLYDRPGKRGHHEHVGIKRVGHRWAAKRDGKYLGTFATAAQAAAAYQSATPKPTGQGEKV